MANLKRSSTILIVSLILIGLTAVTSAADFEWATVTSFNDARRIRVINDTVYAVTSGGLLVVPSAVSTGQRYTNLDGVGTVDLTDIIEAADGQKWITGFGRLIKYSGVSSTLYPVIDNEGTIYRLYCVEDDGDWLWVGTDHGLILFSKVNDGGQIQDSYQLFGDLNSEPSVFDIELSGDSIWLATSAGLAAADRSVPNRLKSPANWKGYEVGEYSEMMVDTVRSVVRFGNAIFIGAAMGTYRVDVATDTLVRLDFAQGAPVRDLQVEGDSLLIYSDGGFGVVMGGVPHVLSTAGLSSVPRTGAKMSSGRWVGTRAGGIYYSSGGAFQQYPHTGLAQNDVTDVAVDAAGLLTVLLGGKGPYEWRNNNWVHRPMNVGGRALAMQVDGRGWKYVATFGAGVSRVGDTVAKFDASNSTIQSAISGLDYSVCFDVRITSNLLLAPVFEPDGDVRVAVGLLDQLDDPGGWTGFGVADSVFGNQMVSIDCYGNTFAAGSGLSGVFHYDMGADPFDKSDDRMRRYHQNADSARYRLPSDVVRVVRFSPEGEMYVGTSLGLTKYDLSIERTVTVDLPAGFGPDVTSLTFDRRGNTWVGARNGLARIDGLSGDIETFTTGNSGLVYDQVYNLYFDDRSGDLYVATSQGLSIIRSTIGVPTEDIDSVYAFPNPYVVESPSDLLNFNYALNARLRMFTIAGELVAERPQPLWDGRNDAGRPVVSGVYFWVLTDETGDVGRGKILLIRK